MEHGARSMERGARSMEHGAWSMVRGARSTEQEVEMRRSFNTNHQTLNLELEIGSSLIAKKA